MFPQRPLQRRGNAPRKLRGFRPLLLSKLLGSRPLTPPSAQLEPPSALAGLPERRPRFDASSIPVPGTPISLAALEQLDPAGLHRDHRARSHWDGREWHDGSAHGLIRNGTWAWLYHDGPRWWTLAGEPQRAALLHDRLWWTKQDGIWFVIHDGEPWVWRSFHDWNAQGLFQPASGTEMVYSRDFARVAIIAPGAGAEVFDAKSGELLARIPEGNLPPRQRAKPPLSGVRFNAAQ